MAYVAGNAIVKVGASTGKFDAAMKRSGKRVTGFAGKVRGAHKVLLGFGAALGAGLVVRGETEDGATVSINGEDVETLHGLFIAEVRLQEGPNTITVVSMDPLSNVATVRFIIMYRN